MSCHPGRLVRSAATCTTVLGLGVSTASGLKTLNSAKTLVAVPRRGDDGGEPDGRSRHRSAIESEVSGYAAFFVQCIQIATSHGESFNDFLVALARGLVQRSLSVAPWM